MAARSVSYYLSQTKALDIAHAGFAGVNQDIAGRAVTLYVKQPSAVPQSIRDFAAELGVELKVAETRYSLQELQQAASAITDKYAASVLPGYTIAFIKYFSSHDIPGLTIWGSYPDSSQSPDPKVAAELSTLTGIAVRFASHAATYKNFDGRTSDSNPFYSGGLMRQRNPTAVCSNGFAINIGGSSHVTTARHCKSNSYYTFADSGQLDSHYYGVSTQSQPTDGAGRILSRAGSGYMFAGGRKANDPRSVVGYSPVGPDSLIDTSGGNTGAHLHMTVTMNGAFNDGDGFILLTPHFRTPTTLQQAPAIVAGL